MKSNSTASILVGILAISALASVVLCIMWVSNVRQFRGLQQQVARVNQNRVVATQLAAELVEYSKRNPAIDPLLVTFRIKENPSIPGAGATAPKR
jgi:hypothetical protein